MLMRPTVSNQKGFTLIELMICVAVVAILAAVALPSYQSHVRKGRRADAQAFMMDVAARQQHRLVDRRAYAEAIIDLGLAPPSNVANFYSVALEAVNVAGTPPTFLITATPTGSQANDSCGALKLDEKGIKTQTGPGRCW